MKVSIITTCFNSEKTITVTIFSVLNQTYSNIEYIIIDGSSKDSTLDKINKYANKINILVSEPDQGMYYAMNEGISLASGDLIGILNSDDLFYNNQIIDKVVTCIKNDNSDAVYGDLIYFNNNKITRYWKAGNLSIKKMKFGWMPPHPTLFVKKNIYDKFGLFDVSFKTSADYELILRFLLKHNINVSYIPDVLIKMKTGGQSNRSIKNRIKANIEDKRAWNVNNLKMPFYTRYLKPVLKINQYLKKY